MQIWVPDSAKPGFRCRLCAKPFWDELQLGRHVISCYRSQEHEIRTARINPLLSHPDPELEDFMHKHGSLNRKKGERRGPHAQVPSDS